jgi:beta-galactosidase/beta-glucuronidase
MRNEYPRPDFVRDSFISLDEEWDFDFDDRNVGHQEKWYRKHTYSKKIQVPFSFQSKLGGIEDLSFHDHLWYHLRLPKIRLGKEERLILHLEGVDYYSEVYLNGDRLADHYGANCGYVVDLTEALDPKANDLVLYVKDPSQDRSIPRGKQDWEEKSHEIWYTRTSGIYKPAWLQVVNAAHIRNFYLTPRLEHYTVNVDLETTLSKGRVEMEVTDWNEKNPKLFAFALTGLKADYSFSLPDDYVNDRIWKPDWPYLFHLTFRLFDEKGAKKDEVKTYFAFRDITAKDGKVYLNGYPIYQKLILNQGYYPDGVLTAPTVEAMEKDIDAIKALGFNGCRIHQKCEDPYFLYLCDKKGLFVWQECAANYGFSSYSQRRMLNEWIDIVKTNYNHPSIICYTPMNESWGIEGIPYDQKIQAYDQALYYLIHSLDDTRLVISNDGWEQCKTDLLTVHNYRHGAKDEKEKQAHFHETLSDRKHILDYAGIERLILCPGFEDEGQPILLTEFGGVAFRKDAHGKAWGYTTSSDEKEYIADLTRIYAAIADSSCLEGICYTQLTDVEQEMNGFLTFDRKFKVDPKKIKALNDTLKVK